MDGGPPGPPETPLAVGVEDEVGCERRLRQSGVAQVPSQEGQPGEAGGRGERLVEGGETVTQMVSISGRFRDLPQPLMPHWGGGGVLRGGSSRNLPEQHF